MSSHLLIKLSLSLKELQITIINKYFTEVKLSLFSSQMYTHQLIIYEVCHW